MDYSNMAFPKPKRAKKRKIIVSEQTYTTTMEKCKFKCVLCGRNDMLVIHHILYRSERKDLIDEPSNCIILCNDCHLKVHQNKHKWQPILLKLRSKL